MGETGCGKTLLIRKLSEMLNDGEFKMKILNIHADICNRDIINFIEDKVINITFSILTILLANPIE